MARLAGRAVASGILAGCALAALLVLGVLLIYPGTPATSAAHLGEGGLALALLATTGIGTTWALARPADPATALARRWGARAGLAFGLAWVAEISFNNLVPPAISVGDARFWVDNGVWALVIAGTLALGALAARQTGRASAGAALGAWSGLIGGLCACLMALGVIVFGMPFLARDPYNLAEWASRGPASGAPDLPTYLAYDTLAGALGHLVAIGLLQGLALGLIGGLCGRVLSPARAARPPL